MNIWIVRINEVLLVYDNGMQVDPVLNRINFGISCPPVGHDMRTGQNVLFNQRQKGGSTAVWNFSQEALARFSFYAAENPVSSTPLATVIFSGKVKVR